MHRRTGGRAAVTTITAGPVRCEPCTGGTGDWAGIDGLVAGHGELLARSRRVCLLVEQVIDDSLSVADRVVMLDMVIKFDTEVAGPVSRDALRESRLGTAVPAQEETASGRSRR